MRSGDHPRTRGKQCSSTLASSTYSRSALGQGRLSVRSSHRHARALRRADVARSEKFWPDQHQMTGSCCSSGGTWDHSQPKVRALELRAGQPWHRGRKARSGRTSSLREVRRRGNRPRRTREVADRQLVADWQANKPARNKRGGCRQWGATLRPSSGNPARRGFHPHASLFGRGSPAPTPILRRSAPMHTLDFFIRRIDHASDLRREREQGDDLLPGLGQPW